MTESFHFFQCLIVQCPPNWDNNITRMMNDAETMVFIRLIDFMDRAQGRIGSSIFLRGCGEQDTRSTQ